jgi:flagellar basal body-associated protein FliL
MAKTNIPPHEPGANATRIVLLLGIAAVPALGTGFAIPWLLHRPQPAAGQPSDAPRHAYVSFGEVVAPLHEKHAGQMRQVLVNVLLVVDAAAAGPVAERIGRRKPALTSWLIHHLSEKSLTEVTESAGVRKLRWEILEEFNQALVSEGSARIREVFLQELAVQ